MSFIPNTPKETDNKVPLFDNVREIDGWQGMSTTKSLERLKEEVTTALELLGGMNIQFMRGFHVTGEGENNRREGYQITYVIAMKGKYVPGRLDIAALPVDRSWRRRDTIEKRSIQSLKMALFMLNMALKGSWFLSKLSPGYAPLMPWMLAEDGKTITEHWGEAMGRLLPPPASDFVEGEVV